MATVRSVAGKLRGLMQTESGKAVAATSRATVPGTVTALDGLGNATVSLGNGQEALAFLGVGARVGDNVAVELGDMSAVVTRNTSDPPDNAVARAAEKVADEAQAVAEAVGQHFWDDGNGVHVADEERADWDEEWAKPDHGSIGSPTDQRPWHNILMNSLGILLRRGVYNLVGITRSAIAFYDGLGSAAANVVARFGSDGAQIGKADESHIEMDYHSMKLVDMSGNTYFHVSDLRSSDGFYQLTESFSGTVSTAGDYTITLWYEVADSDEHPPTVRRNGTDHTDFDYEEGSNVITLHNVPTGSLIAYVTYRTLGTNAKALTFGSRGEGDAGPGSFAHGDNVVSGGYFSHAEGHDVDAHGTYAHAEGDDARAYGYASHSEGGQLSLAYGQYSHSEGASSEARGFASHAEGYNTVARASSSHSEGRGTEASGTYAHAEGYGTTASAYASHAEGYGTKSSAAAGIALGTYNVENPSASIHGAIGNIASSAFKRYAVIVGNGTSDDARRNAAALDWGGNTKYWSTVNGISTSANNGVSTRTYLHQDVFLGGNGERTGCISNVLYPSWPESDANSVSTYIEARNCKTDGTFVAAYLDLFVRKDGTKGANLDGDLLFNGEKAYPLFIWTTTNPESYSGSYPVSPCFVYYTGNGGLYYCTD